MLLANAIAFLSYARYDDTNDERAIAELCDRLAGEVQALTGKPFLILRDTKDIPWGKNWKRFIEEGLAEATFLIVIMTPSYFKSPTCRWEYEEFRKREQSLGRDDLILPLHYIDCLELDDGAKDSWHHELAGRNHVNWRPFRGKSLRTNQVRETICVLASAIVRAMRLFPLVASESPKIDEGRWAGESDTHVAPASLVESQQRVLNAVRLEYFDELPFDKVYQLLVDRNPRLVTSVAELYYRLKDLSRAGHINLEQDGPRNTIVQSRPKSDVVQTVPHNVNLRPGKITSTLIKDNLVREYGTLSGAQKDLLQLVYRSMGQILLSLDKVIEKYGLIVGSYAELVYRIKDLESSGWLKITDSNNVCLYVAQIPEVLKAMAENRILST